MYINWLAYCCPAYFIPKVKEMEEDLSQHIEMIQLSPCANLLDLEYGKPLVPKNYNTFHVCNVLGGN